MTKQEKLKVYNDCKKEVSILEQGNEVNFCKFENPFSCGFYVERLSDDELGILFDVNGYLMRHQPEISAIVFKFITTN